MNCKCWNLKTLGTPVAVQSCGGRQMKTSHFTQGRQKREIVALPVFCTLSHFNQLPSSQFHTNALSDGELQNLFGEKKALRIVMKYYVNKHLCRVCVFPEAACLGFSSLDVRSLMSAVCFLVISDAPYALQNPLMDIRSGFQPWRYEHSDTPLFLVLICFSPASSYKMKYLK